MEEAASAQHREIENNPRHSKLNNNDIVADYPELGRIWLKMRELFVIYETGANDKQKPISPTHFSAS